MGYYINPTNGNSKEEFLELNGEKLSNPPNWSDIPEDKVIICLVTNALFKAAGVMHSESKLNALKKNNVRPKVWYLVPKEIVTSNSDWNG